MHPASCILSSQLVRRTELQHSRLAISRARIRRDACDSSSGHKGSELAGNMAARVQREQRRRKHEPFSRIARGFRATSNLLPRLFSCSAMDHWIMDRGPRSYSCDWAQTHFDKQRPPVEQSTSTKHQTTREPEISEMAAGTREDACPSLCPSLFLSRRFGILCTFQCALAAATSSRGAACTIPVRIISRLMREAQALEPTSSSIYTVALPTLIKNPIPTAMFVLARKESFFPCRHRSPGWALRK